jgi:hypothetical protein
MSGAQQQQAQQPDTGSSSKSINAMFATSFPLGLLTFLLAIAILTMFSNSSLFNITYWLIFPLFVFIAGFCFNLASQYMACTKVNAVKALYGGLPLLGTTYVALMVSLVPFFRNIVASAIAPLFLNKTYNVTTAKTNVKLNVMNSSSSNTKYGSPVVGLNQLESMFPMVKAIAVGFYVFFGTVFGQVMGSGISQIC